MLWPQGGRILGTTVRSLGTRTAHRAPHGGSQMPEHLLDSIVSGVVTNEELDTEPYGFRVGWIRWFSGFRDTDLRISDLVIGLDGVAYDREKRKEFRHKAFGSYSEDQHWAQVGARDGRRLVVGDVARAAGRGLRLPRARARMAPRDGAEQPADARAASRREAPRRLPCRTLSWSLCRADSAGLGSR